MSAWLHSKFNGSTPTFFIPLVLSFLLLFGFDVIFHSLGLSFPSFGIYTFTLRLALFSNILLFILLLSFGAAVCSIDMACAEVIDRRETLCGRFRSLRPNNLDKHWEPLSRMMPDMFGCPAVSQLSQQSVTSLNQIFLIGQFDPKANAKSNGRLAQIRVSQNAFTRA